MGLVEYGNKYYDEKKPWILFKENMEEFKKVMYNCANIIANLANLFEPIMPETANKIKGFLDIDISNWEKITIDKTLKLDNVEPLFERIK